MLGAWAMDAKKIRDEADKIWLFKPGSLATVSEIHLDEIMKRMTSRFSRTLLVCSALAIGLTGCKKGEEAPEDSGTSEVVAKAPEPPKPPPVTDVKLAKKWPDGNAVTFVKSVKFVRATAAGTNNQERTTTYNMNFGGGAPVDGAAMDGGGGDAGAGAATLAKSLDMKIVGQKFEIGVNGRPMIAFSGSAMGGDGGGGDEMMDNPDPAAGGGGGAARPNPVAKAVEKSMGNSVKFTFDATGKITKVDGLQPLQGKVLTGAPRGVWKMIGGMFSETVFKEAPLFHTLLTGADVKKDAPWIHREKGMMLLNWQQDFTFTNTFTAMEDWNGRKVAAFNITGAISGSTTTPVKSDIAPGGNFTGKALYAPDLGILVQRTINGSFDATEVGQAAKYQFTQEFKVTELGGGGDDM
ncbi:MAG: hypothetical protein ACPGVU_08445 [Limisphaerales bacterium]